MKVLSASSRHDRFCAILIWMGYFQVLTTPVDAFSVPPTQYLALQPWDASIKPHVHRNRHWKLHLQMGGETMQVSEQQQTNTLPKQIQIQQQQQEEDSVQDLQSQPPVVESTSSASKSYLDDGFIFGLAGSGLERPKGKVPSIVVEGDSLETKPYQVILVLVTMCAHAGFALNAVSGMLAVNGGHILWTVIQAVSILLASWIAADFGSGVLHWSVDNYGNGRTPIMGSIIAAFQGHHSAPWTITKRGFANNVHKLCIPFGVMPMALITAIAGPFTTFFFTCFCVFEILSQEFHKWSHMTKGECPSWVNWLQSVGVSVARKPHALHHMEPFDGNYCIISGVCNPTLDESGLFRRLEHWIFKINGVESNAWKLDPELRERTLRGDYGIPTFAK